MVVHRSNHRGNPCWEVLVCYMMEVYDECNHDAVKYTVMRSYPGSDEGTVLCDCYGCSNRIKIDRSYTLLGDLKSRDFVKLPEGLEEVLEDKK